MLAKLRASLLDYLVLKPTRNDLDFADAEREYVELQKHRVEFFIQQHGPEGSPTELLILKFPGTAGRAERGSAFPASALTDTNTKLWTWNPPGYGKSEGKATLPMIADTALQFFNYARSQHEQDLPIWLVGNSLGCLSALHVASKIKNCQKVGLIMRNPPDLIPVVKNVARKYPFGAAVDSVAESLCDEMNASVSAPNCTSPALFLQSECDTLVPPKLQDAIVGNYGGDKRKVVLSGLGHDDKLQTWHRETINSGIRWLWSKTK